MEIIEELDDGLYETKSAVELPIDDGDRGATAVVPSDGAKGALAVSFGSPSLMF